MLETGHLQHVGGHLQRPKDPVHLEFEFCARSLCTRRAGNGFLTVVNLFPFATELRKWLGGEPFTLSVITEQDGAFDNPFCHHSSFLVWMFMCAFNDFAQFAMSREHPGYAKWEIDLAAMRHAAEVVLYSTRLAECLFKQVLYCTNLDPNLYFRASLGHLLDCRCPSCKGPAKHRISLIGSLAHRYKMCGVYEHCVETDLRFLNGIRNQQVAHATVGEVKLEGTPDRALAKAKLVLDEIRGRMAHFLEHVAELENRVLAELQSRLDTEYPLGPYNSNLISTYYWQQSLLRFLHVLRKRAAAMSRRAEVERGPADQT